MILFVNDNTGILFLSRLSTGVKHFISGTVDALSVVTGAVKGHGLLSGVIGPSSIVSGKMVGYIKISGVINTFSRVTGELNTSVIIEIIRIKSAITRILKINSKL